MAAVTANGSSSLIEMGAAKLGKMLAARRARRGQRGGIFAFLGELLGTVVALACLTIAAFVAGFAAGMAAAGIAVLLLDFKVTVVRRVRAAQQPGRAR